MEDTLDIVSAKHGMAQKLFYASLRGAKECSIRVRYGAATQTFGDPGHALKAELIIHSDRFFTRAVLGGDIGVGEAYMDGDWSSPDVVSVVRAAIRNMPKLDARNRLISLVTRALNHLRHLRNDNTEIGSRKNIAYHYDLGNEFYRLFLDPSMAYSCAYYENSEASLEMAQERKFNTICRKLDLQPGDHVIEIGTGWGGFAVYASTHYGCRVTTTTISKEQHAFSAKLFASLPEDRVRLLFEDYRKLTGSYDKLVSIEMFEAVGYKHYDEFFSICERLLKPNGKMLLQTITMNERHFDQYLQQSDWIKKYIFPGAELASLAGILKSTARVSSLQLVGAEDIGEHYALTLREWRRRFMSRLPEVRGLGFDDIFVRMWNFYLAYCEAGFLEHYIGDAQLMLAKPGASFSLPQPNPLA
jgi:cyclopropane-fatty-acyl-phospholipid synthase